jgi:soluble lytic murein transglycosylase-like protein
MLRPAALLAGILLVHGCAAASPAEIAGPFRGPAGAYPPHHARYGDVVLSAARRHAIPPALMLAIIRAESDFNPRAVSHKGAVGLMQLMPSTARWMAPGVSRDELFDPAVNVEIGARYLRYLANRYHGDARKILIAWNAGPGRLDRGHIPKETKVFVERVRRHYQLYARS